MKIHNANSIFKVFGVLTLFLVATFFASGAEWVRPLGNTSISITVINKTSEADNATYANNVNCADILGGTDTNFCVDDGAGSFLSDTGDVGTGNYSWRGNFSFIEPASNKLASVRVNSSGCIIITGGQFGGTIEVC